MSTPVFQQITTKLDQLNIEYKTAHHDPTRTSADAARIRGVDLHSGAKAIVVKGKKSGAYFLFVMPADLKMDNQKAKAAAGEAVAFARDVEEVTGCVPGSVPPFGSVIGLRTFVDPRLAENEIINFNAGSITDSIEMRYEDYLAAEKPEVVEIAKEI